MPLSRVSGPGSPHTGTSRRESDSSAGPSVVKRRKLGSGADERHTDDLPGFLGYDEDWDMEPEDRGEEEPFPSDDSPHDQRNFCASQAKRYKKLAKDATAGELRHEYSQTAAKYERWCTQLWDEHKGLAPVRPLRDCKSPFYATQYCTSNS